MSGNDDAKTAKIEVWWDMRDCPIPEGYDARRVRPSIERAFKKLGYTGRVSITAYGDQNQTPCHVLRGLSSTGVAVVQTISDSTRSVMYRDMVEWRGHNPPPATIVIISDQVEGEFSWDLARLQQRTRYHLFLAYSIKRCKDLFLLYKANWRWEKLLEEEEEGGTPAGGLSSAAVFYCKSCNFNCQSLKTFRKHLSSYKHGLEEAINSPDSRLSCVTKTWAKNYPATPEHATAKIHVLWDMNDCPIPEGYDACRVRPSIESAFKELGYTGPISITAFADQKQIPDHHLLALSSTGVVFAHTLFPFRPFEMPVLLTSAEWLWKSLLSGACFLFVLSCVTKTWARNYPATPEHATAEIHVWWDMKDCPIPEGYDARRVLPSIESAFKEIGYSGPVSITAFADQKETPDHHLLALSSTGVDFAHTLPWVLHSRMITDCEEWIEDNPAPATVMIISDELASPKSHSSLLCRKLQESNYNCFLAYSVRPFEKPVLVTSAEWLWDSLLAVSETKRQTLQKGCESESESDVEFTGMFYCDLCDSDCESLDDFKKHLSSKEHTHEDNIMNTHFQSFSHRHRQFKISNYYEEARYPPKTKRMRKAPRKGFLPRSLRFTRR
ncbi:hypothetical protein HID58_093184 [Brassica napus]|uniref:C2H2-type domain-containing protein n=1 Tax=Brassica napus TaxID=3708 RepID=A0ABQ7XDC7_BRANA|nr:hypothetical protein HID58_093184 [Brassica napus]